MLLYHFGSSAVNISSIFLKDASELFLLQKYFMKVLKQDCICSCAQHCAAFPVQSHMKIGLSHERKNLFWFGNWQCRVRQSAGLPTSLKFSCAHLRFGLYSFPAEELWLIGQCVRWGSNRRVSGDKWLPAGRTDGASGVSWFSFSVAV